MSLISEDTEETENVEEGVEEKPEEEDQGKLTRDEEMAVGRIPVFVYVQFLTYCGMFAMIGVFALILFFMVLRAGVTVFLQLWIDEGDGLMVSH